MAQSHRSALPGSDHGGLGSPPSVRESHLWKNPRAELFGPSQGMHPSPVANPTSSGVVFGIHRCIRYITPEFIACKIWVRV
jgi:hypothetical protein